MILEGFLSGAMMSFCADSTPSKYSETRARKKKEKYVPVYGQNVLAFEPSPGMEYALTWLKAEKLHKYWPMISRFTYHQLLMLNSANWELILNSVGVRSHVVTMGAKERILRLTGELRKRAGQLKEAIHRGRLDELIDRLLWILRTPLADVPELDGEKLIPLVRRALDLVMTKAKWGSYDRSIFKSVNRLQELFKSHPSVAELNFT